MIACWSINRLILVMLKWNGRVIAIFLQLYANSTTYVQYLNMHLRFIYFSSMESAIGCPSVPHNLPQVKPSEKASLDTINVLPMTSSPPFASPGTIYFPCCVNSLPLSKQNSMSQVTFWIPHNNSFSSQDNLFWVPLPFSPLFYFYKVATKIVPLCVE